MSAEACRCCGQCPSVLVAVTHPGMRRLIVELLEREQGCWCASLRTDDNLRASIVEQQPDLVLVDHADFPRCCRDELTSCPRTGVVVIGPERDDAYRAAATRHGASGWVARDDVGEHLTAEMRRALGCTHSVAARTASR